MVELKCLIIWRVTTSFTGNADPISSNWERNDTAPCLSYLGSQMTESSGVFTFPSTGIYLIIHEQNYKHNSFLLIFQPIYKQQQIILLILLFQKQIRILHLEVVIFMHKVA